MNARANGRMADGSSKGTYVVVADGKGGNSGGGGGGDLRGEWVEMGQAKARNCMGTLFRENSHC